MSLAGRASLAALVVAALLVAGVILFSGGDSYQLHLELADAGGLISGSNVRVDGVPAGQVEGLRLDSHDRLTADLGIDANAAPVGRNARATVEVDGLFGETFVNLQRGNVRNPLPSGATLPVAQTGDSVRWDQLLDVADQPTRQALQVFLQEEGTALVGRGQDLGQMLAALPPTLSSTRDLMNQFSSNSQALGRLIDESDQVVASIARQRASLGHFVHSAGDTFATLASRQQDLGETVDRAPATLTSATRALAALQGAAAPLIPAARGLRETAPALTDALRQLPGFAAAANPTLTTLRSISPELQRLGQQGTHPARRLVALAASLATYASAADPFTSTLNQAFPDLLGVMEGWARATQPKDAAGHVFRFGLSTSPKMFASLLPALGGPQTARSHTASRQRPTAQRQPSVPPPSSQPQSTPSAAAQGAPAPSTKTPTLLGIPLPKLNLPIPKLNLPLPKNNPGQPSSGTTGPIGNVGNAVQSLLNYLLGK